MRFIEVDNNSKISSGNTKAKSVNQKDMEVLGIKASQILLHYSAALGCPVSIIDKDGVFLSSQDETQMAKLCAVCKEHFQKNLAPHKDYGHCCEIMHKEAGSEARCINGSYIYVCNAGLVYWVSPLYRNGRYIGALIAGQVTAASKGNAKSLLKNIPASELSQGEITKLVYAIPDKTHEEIQMMAQMLFLYAKAISEKPRDRYTALSAMPDKIPLQDEGETSTANVAAVHPKPQHDKHEVHLTHPMEKERMLLAALRRGDKQTSSKIIEELMGDILAAVPGDLETGRLRAIELVVLLSREAVSGSARTDVLLENNNRYLRRILESKTTEELMENLHYAIEGMSSSIFFFQGIRHASVLRKAERYIWANYTRKLSLEEIAKAAGLSPPYFSTIFKEEMGENLSSYLNRLRVERAVSMLTETEKHLQEIANLCGFEDQSWFSKIFKSFTGVSPGKFKKNGGNNSEHKG